MAQCTVLTDKGIAVVVQHLLVLTLRGLNHHRVGDRPGHSGSVETVVLQPLGYVNGIHVRCTFELPHVHYELMGIEPWMDTWGVWSLSAR